MGLGDAIRRLLQVEAAYRQGTHIVPAEALREKDLIVQALNQIDLTLGFDCDGDNRADVPVTVDIFELSAKTSCCRLQDKDEGKVPEVKSPEAKAPEPSQSSSEPKTRGRTRATSQGPAKKKSLFGFFGKGDKEDKE